MNMENLGAVPSHSFICYDAGEQRQERHSIFRSNFRAFTNTKRHRVQARTRGKGSGIATIEGDTAIFKPEGAEEECRIALKFTGGKLVVTQTGICGFGHNVTAAGTYKKISAKKPKFESN